MHLPLPNFGGVLPRTRRSRLQDSLLRALWLVVLGAVVLTLSPVAHAQLAPGPNPPVICAFSTSPPTVATGNFVLAQCDSSGHLLTSSAGATSPNVGAATISSGQYSNATASAAQVVAARTGAPGTGRASLTLYNSGSVAVFVGPSGVTTATGIRILPSGSYTLYTTAAVFAVPASGTGTLDYLETY